MQIVYSCRYCTKNGYLGWIAYGWVISENLLQRRYFLHTHNIYSNYMIVILLSLNTWIGIFFSGGAGACVRQNDYYNNDAIDSLSCEQHYAKENLQ